MDEAEVQHRARLFVASTEGSNVRGDLSPYLKVIDAVLVRQELGPGESGMTITCADGKHIITVNTLESEARQRFTICHEIGHVVLKLPSSHEEFPPWAPVKRDPNEIACDTFAAELLMPYRQWMESLPNEDPSHSVIEKLASEFGCSYPAAASRYAALANIPCACITIEHEVVRYVARSASLRRLGAWIAPRTKIPNSSVAYRLRVDGEKQSDVGLIEQDVWFQDWEPGLECEEICRHDPNWDVTTSLVWLEEDAVVERERDRYGKPITEEAGLDELTGILPWRGRSKRRK